MPPKKRVRKEDTKVVQETAPQTGVDTENRMNETSSVNPLSLLEERAAHGETEALLMLAEHFAYGNGVKQDLQRAERLISEAAGKGNKEAREFVEFINKWKGQKGIALSSLQNKGNQLSTMLDITTSRTVHRYF